MIQPLAKDVPRDRGRSDHVPVRPHGERGRGRAEDSGEVRGLGGGTDDFLKDGRQIFSGYLVTRALQQHVIDGVVDPLTLAVRVRADRIDSWSIASLRWKR